MQERPILEENYRFLRKIEHRLQIMFDLQTHTLPDSDKELRRLAIRMGYVGSAAAIGAGRVQSATCRRRPTLNRKILDHLLHDAFGDDPASGAGNRSGAGPGSAAGDASRRVCGRYRLPRRAERPTTT